MSDHVKAPPPEFVGDIQAVATYFANGVVAGQRPRLTVPAQVDEGVGELIGVEVGQRRGIRSVVAVPVVHHQHGLWPSAMYNEAQALTARRLRLIDLGHLKHLLCWRLKPKGSP